MQPLIQKTRCTIKSPKTKQNYSNYYINIVIFKNIMYQPIDYFEYQTNYSINKKNLKKQDQCNNKQYNYSIANKDKMDILNQQQQQQQQPNSSTHKYQNQHCSLQIFAQQSENCQLIVGNINVQTKRQMLPITFQVQLKGVYKVYDIPKKIDQSSTHSHIDISQTLSQFQNAVTRRNDKLHMLQTKEGLQTQQCFLEGLQKLAQISQKTQIVPDTLITYPFLFNVPAHAPASIQAIWFANKRIQINYYLSVKGYQQKQKQPFISCQFQLKIRQSSIKPIPQPKLSKIIEYRCFSRFFCKCLGTYHIELNAMVLHPGQIQLQGRIFREGSKTQKIITELDITLMGQMKNVKKLVIGKKKMIMKQNQFQMLEGQILMGYDPDLRSFSSQLITINYWIQCKVEFVRNIWKFVKKQATQQIVL